ncbi:trypsin-like peptidase domain-containing protein [Streptomyces gobiensis]|uniref:trypsin-like peptidase domain-containing protein n=1 Tax=Streptomyces gobiensis TaxID=2875706 RepID=UPI001E42F8B1|nr:trypsin-like peptidase domain-containing protein [Streptomyces gobiensis]UGY94894.1 trypsin-like peptidase domain-containing protein [Streptomyces gobiensis]
MGTTGILAAGLLWGGSPAPAVEPSSAADEAPLLDAGSPAGKKFRASGRLIGGNGTTCTATLIHATGKPDPADKALVLSNGHCVSDSMKTNEVIASESAPAGWSFTPAFFHDNVSEHQRFPVERITYATMKDIDVSVLQLSATYGDLQKLEVTPRTLSAGRPAVGSALQAAHAPTDGVQDGKRFLRLSDCAVTASSVSLHEYTWLWEGATRTDCLGISGGSSGGAVTATDGNQLVGLINTVSTSGYLGCGLGRPCEGSPSGLVVPKDNTVYATPVDAVASCLDERGLRLDKQGCRLDRGQQVNVTASGQHTQSETSQGRARWDAHITPAGDQAHAYVTFKSGPLGVIDCKKPEGYAKPQPLTSAGVDYDELLAEEDNIYVLCVVGGPDNTLRGHGWDTSFAHPSYAYARVDNTAPSVPPQVDIERFGSGAEASYWVRPVYAPWEITAYKVKYGPEATIDCADPEGYRHYLGVPTTLKASEGPWTYCAIGYDNADNPTKPAAFALPSTTR